MRILLMTHPQEFQPLMFRDINHSLSVIIMLHLMNDLQQPVVLLTIRAAVFFQTKTLSTSIL